MDISKLTAAELENRLKELWDRADNLPHDSEEYDKIVDEILRIRKYYRDNGILLSESITAGF